MSIFNSKSFLKSVVYRVFASGITAAMAFCVTGNVRTSTAIGIMEFVGKIFSYYVFEVGWNAVANRFSPVAYRRDCSRFNLHGRCVLFTGLNCSGKTTLAKAFARNSTNCVLLDGDAVRSSINYDLGFTPHDIRTNLQKVANLAVMLMDQGYDVLISCIAKSRADREFMRETIGEGRYAEVRVDCGDAALEERQRLLHPDTKVLQRDYEESEYGVIRVDTSRMTVEECLKEIECRLKG